MGKQTSTTSFDLAPDHLMQNINPWKLMFRPTGQLGFINIYNMASADRSKEEEIISEVAGYGRQLGRIIDVLTILLAEAGPPTKGRTPRQEEVIDAFLDMARRIAEVRGQPTAETVLAAMETLKSRDPAGHKRVLDELAKPGA